MKNRQPTPGKEGRVLIRFEDGTAKYATISMADDPIAEGDPIDKSTLLKDATAALYGLDSTAVPDEVLERISRMFPANMGVLTVYIASAGGSPIDTMIKITPAINGETDYLTLPNGRFSIFAPPGSYTVSIIDSPFVITSDSAKSVTVTAGCFAKTSFTAKWVSSGKSYIKASRTLYVPEHLSSVDLCAIGGGGSGGQDVNNNGRATGGAGGYLNNLLGTNLAGKLLNIIIGSGGALTDHLNAKSGASGGTTSVSVDSASIIEAAGGAGGNHASSGNVSGADGGSGSGGVYSDVCYDGGSDGSNGSGSNGGNGQGTTTREFGENTGTLYCGAGGAANYSNASTSSGGAGGGGDGACGNKPVAESGTAYGAGGGGACGYNGQTAGDGYQGVLIIRW